MSLPKKPKAESAICRSVEPRHDTSGPSGDFDAPRVLVSDPWPPRSLPLGLEQPLAVLGHNRMGLDEGCASVPLDWLPRLLSLIDISCAQLIEDEAPGFRLPPIALEGEPGCGRTHIGRQIAAHFCVHHFVWDLRKSRRTPDFDMRMPLPPVTAMALSRSANPVISVRGADDGVSADIEQLAGMIDPACGRSWFDPVVEAAVDTGHVSWLVQTSDATRLPPMLLRQLMIVSVEGPSSPVQPELILSLIEEVSRDLGLGLPIDTVRFERVHVLVDMLLSKNRQEGGKLSVEALRQTVRAGLL